VEIDRAVNWVLGRPEVFLNTVGDTHLLPKVLDAAKRFRESSPDGEMRDQVTRLQMVPAFV
jgi:hypothetical protein